MGNEESQSSGINFDSNAIEVTDNWTLYHAYNVNGSTRVRSAFISQQGTSDHACDSLKKLAKNLMIHRHPCIVQFISSWSKNNSFYLITEEVKPLAQVIGNQSALQICIGLHSILKAVTFLHEKALSSHNNLCCASIYVTPEGVWKLGGLDYLMKFSDITPSYLQKSRAHRYEKAVPPEEDSLQPTSKINAEAIDQYAFGVLVEEVLKKKTNDEIPHLLDFKLFCKKKLHSLDPLQRCKLSEIMSHEFFSHDFIRIHQFLSELPLKLQNEKEEFFRDLTEQLTLLPEEIVASQLASLLLSRIVILDETAQEHLLPIILKPKTGSGQETIALFSESIFKRHIVPKLLQMFCVRDAQVRLILLTHFRLYYSAFTLEQLKHQVLPELLIGIKDVNDKLVSMTLKVLADLVIILGASTVIGGKRGKLFTDGRPKAHSSTGIIKSPRRVRAIKRESPMRSDTRILYGNGLAELPQRFSPDGGEDDDDEDDDDYDDDDIDGSGSSAGELEMDDDYWSDWELSGEKDVMGHERARHFFQVESYPTSSEKELKPSKKRFHANRQALPDITSLDIKCSVAKVKAQNGESDVDFFRDMEPVISRTTPLNVNATRNKFEVSMEAEEAGVGWNGDWGTEDDTDS